MGCRRELGDRAADRLARVLGLEDRGVARLLEDLAHEVVGAREAVLDDHRTVGELLGDALLLARPARAVRRDPHPRDAGRLDLAGPRPAVDVSRGVDLGAPGEALVG